MSWETFRSSSCQVLLQKYICDLEINFLLLDLTFKFLFIKSPYYKFTFS
ncbi:hypothetical protein CHY_2538 [Carboxydothermus hydrogenoformans Z-2901]|uniref:Uncharacterized protein n=1 Tax=Carboxydothermus hydrogenoformans (strain ATCC BAA-161 / DSM 6008 / Z-2901) TaxID=246194 RepID=Q3A953_CARHZ|nr:hypothetical protein CHY_2538 [Carboxydothermus hydrogenoformans Z-2901]